MNKLFISALLAAFILTACSSASTVIFGKKTPLEKYEEKLEDTGLEKTPEGRQWLAVSDKALQHPVTIELPYSHAGNFSLTKPQAIGLQFLGQQGEKLTFAVDKNQAADFVLYAELYQQNKDGEKKLLLSPDTNISTFTYTIEEAGNYVLKIQPQLFRAGSYQLSIASGPSLYFPVADKKAYIGSVWGDDRDAGKRRHEGVDIFAQKRTPAVAAADGYIVGVREGGIGGKTVWLRPEGQNVTLYYAHLDEQLVQEGQAVKKGDTVGLVGNTGNAKYTPSHLHFGVYGYGGAINPYPYVNRRVNVAPVAPQKKLPNYLRLLKDFKTTELSFTKNTLLAPVAVTAKNYIAELPDGSMLQIPIALVQSATVLKKVKAISVATVYTSPEASVLSNFTIPAGSTVSVLGYYNNYAFVEMAETKGWVINTALKG